YDFMGAFVLAGLAIGMGASAVAGEEQEGTFGLLLGNPVSRRGVVVSKSLSMVALTGVGSVILWAWGALAPGWLGIDISGLHIEAMILALFLNALVYGTLALAIGSWTGNRGAASGTSVALMVIGYLAASLFPLIEGLERVGQLFPWHYYSSSRPVISGLDWGHIAVLSTLSLVFFALAYVGIDRRDLKEKSAGTNLFDRLRANPRTRKVMDRIAGSARVSRISVKTTSEFQGLLVITSGIMFSMGLMMPLLYATVPSDLRDFFADFPDVLIAMIGGADMATATGFLQAELFALTGPVAVIVLMVVMGARALAGEEERHTMGLLLANPVSRAGVVREKALAMLAYAIVFGVITFAGTAAGVLLSGIDVTVGGVAATSALLSLFGLVFGGAALAVGAATGRSRLASGVSAAVAVVSYFIWSFFPLSETFGPWAVVSPFELFLGSDPLANGMPWGDAAILLALVLALLAVSIPLFERRDLRG
ncbi:MAG TPA: ABC transporter permease subunit, partial [Acidimicrobiia bacterium]|nr:ABC transporter permease subunit [Acidimicrobiia bacterium]